MDIEDIHSLTGEIATGHLFGSGHRHPWLHQLAPLNLLGFGVPVFADVLLKLVCLDVAQNAANQRIKLSLAISMHQGDKRNARLFPLAGQLDDFVVDL